MARPIKTGLDYFPFDTKKDEKIELIEAEHGLIGYAVICKIWEQIYGDEGYFCNFKKANKLLFCKRNGIENNTLESILKSCFEYKIFNKDMYEKYEILTSKGIQKRYIFACQRRKEVAFKKEYDLISETPLNDVNSAETTINATETQVNATETPINDEFSTQSKVKESKVKYKGRNVRARENISEADYKKLCNDFGKSKVDEYINRTSLYNSCNSDTVRAWILEDEQKRKKKKPPDTGFKNFTERKNDYDELQKQLVNKSITKGG